MEKGWKIVLQQVGKNVESSGRMLQRDKELTYEDLEDLHRTLSIDVGTIKSIQRCATKKDAVL